MRHEWEIEHGELGDNGFHHEKMVCRHCGAVDAEWTPEEAERMHVEDAIQAGEITEENLREGALEEDWIRDALEEANG